MMSSWPRTLRNSLATSFSSVSPIVWPSVIAEADAAYPSWRETHGVTAAETKVVHA